MVQTLVLIQIHYFWEIRRKKTEEKVAKSLKGPYQFGKKIDMWKILPSWTLYTRSKFSIGPFAFKSDNLAENIRLKGFKKWLSISQVVTETDWPVLKLLWKLTNHFSVPFIVMISSESANLGGNF